MLIKISDSGNMIITGLIEHATSCKKTYMFNNGEVDTKELANLKFFYKEFLAIPVVKFSIKMGEIK